MIVKLKMKNKDVKHHWVIFLLLPLLQINIFSWASKRIKIVFKRVENFHLGFLASLVALAAYNFF